MTTYAMPEQPKGPVWDKNGEMWEFDKDSYEIWVGVTGEHKGLANLWEDLLMEYGPLTDARQFKVGDIVSDAVDLENLPLGSIIAETGSFPFYKDSMGGWVNCYDLSENALTGLENVILRIGRGDEA